MMDNLNDDDVDVMTMVRNNCLWEPDYHAKTTSAKCDFTNVGKTLKIYCHGY